MVTGIIGGVLGLFLLCFALFSSSQRWTQSVSHWLIGIVGVILLAHFWRHTTFYLGLQCIAAYVCDNPKTAGKQWSRYSKTLLKTLFTVEVHNETLYNTDRKTPVIFVMNHIANSRPFDEFCLALIEQPNLRIVALPRKPGSYPEIIMKSARYVACKHGGGHDEFISVCAQALREGDSLLLFPEGKNTEHQIHWTQLAAFQSGTFELARETKTPIVPLILEGFNCPNGWIKGHSQNLRLHYLDPLETLEFNTVESLKGTVRHRMQKKMSSIFAKSLPEDKTQMYLKDRAKHFYDGI